MVKKQTRVIKERKPMVKATIISVDSWLFIIIYRGPLDISMDLVNETYQVDKRVLRADDNCAFSNEHE